MSIRVEKTEIGQDIVIKDIKGFEGLYAITSDGRVWSYHSKKFLKLQMGTTGYWQVIFTLRPKFHVRKIHRLIAQAFIPNPENKREVNHINGNKTDNRIENLEWVSRKENTIHAFKTGLMKAGEKHGMAKLSDKEVNKIKKLYLNKSYYQYELAKMFGISQTQISRIITGLRRNIYVI